MYPIWLVEWEAELPGREAPTLRRVKPVRVGQNDGFVLWAAIEHLADTGRFVLCAHFQTKKLFWPAFKTTCKQGAIPITRSPITGWRPHPFFQRNRNSNGGDDHMKSQPSESSANFDLQQYIAGHIEVRLLFLALLKFL